jgi:hypothetical protein
MTWTSFDCPQSTKRWQRLPDGQIEVEGEGIPTREWVQAVDQWAEIIAAKSAKYSVPASWIAAIMSIESGGRTDVCYKVGGVCSTADGAGLMAVLASTAKALIGRMVYPEEMMSNPDLAVDLGAMLMRRLMDQHGEDYVRIAMGYNAGSIRCGTASSGSTVVDDYGPKEICPPTPWGVIMGCVRTSKAISSYCIPSEVAPGRFICPVSYPSNAIKALNSAVQHGWTDHGLGAAGPMMAAGAGGPQIFFPAVAGAAVGYLTVRVLL